MKKFTVAGAILLLLVLQARALAQQWTLEQCLQYALEHNRELLANARSVRASGQDAKAARSQLAPEISASAAIDHYWQIPVQVLPGELIGEPGTSIPVRMGTPWMGNYGLDASLKLADPGTWQNIRLAALRQQAAENEFLSLQKTLQKNVRMAYYQVQQEQDNLATAAKRYDSYSEIHRLIALQYDKGITDKIAFNQSLTLLRDREEVRSKASTLLQLALLDLKFWMGFSLEDTLQVAAPTETVFALPADFTLSLLPDYQWQQSRVELARQQYKAAYAPLYPSLHLTGNYRRLGFGGSVDFIGNSEWFTSGFVGVQLRVPLLSLSNLALTTKQKMQWQQAELEFYAYQEQQQKNYLNTHLQLDQARQTVQTQQENVLLAEENERLTRQKIERGIIDMIQLRQVQQDLLQAQERLLEAKLSYLKHYVEVTYLQNN